MHEHVVLFLQAERIAAGPSVALFVEEGQQSGAVLHDQDITPKVELSAFEKQRIFYVELDDENFILAFTGVLGLRIIHGPLAV